MSFWKAIGSFNKHVTIMEISEAWPSTFCEGYISQFQPVSATEVLRLKISFPISNTISNIITKMTRISISVIKSSLMNRNIFIWAKRKVNGNWDMNMIRILQEENSMTDNNQRRRVDNLSKAVRHSVNTLPPAIPPYWGVEKTLEIWRNWGDGKLFLEMGEGT